METDRRKHLRGLRFYRSIENYQQLNRGKLSTNGVSLSTYFNFIFKPLFLFIFRTFSSMKYITLKAPKNQTVTVPKQETVVEGAAGETAGGAAKVAEKEEHDAEYHPPTRYGCLWKILDLTVLPQLLAPNKLSTKPTPNKNLKITSQLTEASSILTFDLRLTICFSLS